MSCEEAAAERDACVAEGCSPLRGSETLDSIPSGSVADEELDGESGGMQVGVAGDGDVV